KGRRGQVIVGIVHQPIIPRPIGTRQEFTKGPAACRPAVRAMIAAGPEAAGRTPIAMEIAEAGIIAAAAAGITVAAILTIVAPVAVALPIAAIGIAAPSIVAALPIAAVAAALPVAAVLVLGLLRGHR